MTTRQKSSLGKRLLPALAMTTAASGLVALLDRPSHGSAGDLVGAAGAADASGSTGTVPAGDGTPVTTPIPAVSSTLPAVVPKTTTTPTPTPTVTAGAGCQGRTVDGPTVSTRWGPVQVEAVISASGQICDVDAVQSPDSHGRSVRINQQALPILHTEVMQAQSANINGVSGATITSIGYERSLQSILDSVG